MNIEALKKIAQDGSSIGIAPVLGAGGAALLAHSLMSPDEKEEKDESIWKKVLRWLSVVGAGAGGYYLAKSIGDASGFNGSGETTASKIAKGGKLGAGAAAAAFGTRAGFSYANNRPDRLKARAGAYRGEGLTEIADKLEGKAKIIKATRRARLSTKSPSWFFERARRALGGQSRRNFVPNTKGGLWGSAASIAAALGLGALEDGLKEY